MEIFFLGATYILLYSIYRLHSAITSVFPFLCANRNSLTCLISYFFNAKVLFYKIIFLALIYLTFMHRLTMYGWVLPHDDLCSLKILLHQHNEHMLLLFTSCLCIILYVKCKTDISFSFGCYITLFHSELQLNF